MRAQSKTVSIPCCCAAGRTRHRRVILPWTAICFLSFLPPPAELPWPAEIRPQSSISLESLATAAPSPSQAPPQALLAELRPSLGRESKIPRPPDLHHRPDSPHVDDLPTAIILSIQIQKPTSQDLVKPMLAPFFHVRRPIAGSAVFAPWPLTPLVVVHAPAALCRAAARSSTARTRWPSRRHAEARVEGEGQRLAVLLEYSHAMADGYAGCKDRPQSRYSTSPNPANLLPLISIFNLDPIYFLAQVTFSPL